MTNINYDREKLVQINDTPIDMVWNGAEAPTAEAPLAAGSTGQATLSLTADADESGGADIQDLFTVTLTPTIDSERGTISLAVVVTPVNGDASDAPVQTINVAHPQTMDAWQSAAGRARQV